MNQAYATKDELKTLKTEISHGFTNQTAEFNRAINHAIEELGRMIKQGFDGVIEQFGGVQQEFERVYKRFDKVDREIEDVKLRLDQAANRFEMVELERRVEVLERRTGISKE